MKKKQIVLWMLLLTALGAAEEGRGQTVTYSYTITSKIWSEYGTQNLSGVDWTASASGGLYWNYDGTKGQQFGSAANFASQLQLSTLGFLGAIQSVKVSTSGSIGVSSSVSVTVGGASFTPTSTAITSTNTQYSFTGSGSGQILITWTQASSVALYLKTLEVEYTPLPEPTNFPTIYAATSNSSSQITTTWVDASGGQLPTGYLVKASASASPTAPVDGTPETDSPLVMNVAPGTQTAVFANLDPSTTYQFAIWPYTNTGPQINYKTDGQQPTASATTAALYTVYWDGGATTSNWSDAANWSGDALPTTGTIVQIDNTHVPGSYSISLPTGNIRTAVYRLIIQPTAGNTITVTLPAENTYGATNDAGLVVGDKTAATDDIILGSGAVLVNASGASAGNGIQVNSLSNGTIRIENGAKYIHKSDRATGGIVPYLSTSGGTETGVFEYDVPGTGSFIVSTADRNYGSLILSRSSGSGSYSSYGSSKTLTIRGDFTINPGVSFSTFMTGTLQLAGNLTSNGSKLILPAGLAVSFNGTASQVVTGADSIRFDGSATVASTSTVRLAANTSLEVKGVLTNQGTAASLILSQGARLNHRTDGVAATKEWEIAKDGSYHFIAMPFSGTMPAICNGNFAPLTKNFNQTIGETYDFYQWSEATDLASTVWRNLKGDAWALNTTDFGNPPAFAAGRGYAVRYFSGFEGSSTKAVTGTLANGSHTIAITASNNKYNLVGNPYPSSIDWKAATGWGREVLATDGSSGHSIWIWNGATGNYGAYSSGSATDGGTNSVGRYIAPGQGFFVKAATSGSLTMDNNVRKSSPSTYLKSTTPLLALVVSHPASSYSDETRLEFGHLENDGGVAKWWSMYPDAPSLYTTKESQSLSISFLTEVASNPEIPIAFRAGVDGDYSLLVTQGLENFERVTLHDLATGTTQELLQNPVYPFSASTTDAPNRFKVTFGAVGIDTPVASPVSVYTYANRLHILNAGNATVEIINMAGQVVERFHINNENTFSRLLNLRAGAYVVKAVNGLSVNTQRIVIN